MEKRRNKQTKRESGIIYQAFLDILSVDKFASPKIVLILFMYANFPFF